MPKLITIDDGKATLTTALTAKVPDKAARDFCVGAAVSCKDAACTYDKDGGWVTLPDKSMFHEIDREIVKKYALVDKPEYDSYYYHVSADGKTAKMLTHKETLAVIAAQKEVQK